MDHSASPSTSSSEEIPVYEDINSVGDGGSVAGRGPNACNGGCKGGNASHGGPEGGGGGFNPCYITVETEKGELEKYR